MRKREFPDKRVHISVQRKNISIKSRPKSATSGHTGSEYEGLECLISGPDIQILCNIRMGYGRVAWLCHQMEAFSLCEEFTGHRWIPLTKPGDAELWCFLWSAPWMNGWASNRAAGDLRRHRAHNDVIVLVRTLHTTAGGGVVCKILGPGVRYWHPGHEAILS